MDKESFQDLPDQIQLTDLRGRVLARLLNPQLDAGSTVVAVAVTVAAGHRPTYDSGMTSRDLHWVVIAQEPASAILARSPANGTPPSSSSPSAPSSPSVRRRLSAPGKRASCAGWSM